MTRYAVVSEGVVANLASASPEIAAARGWIEAPAHVDLGWLFDGEAFSAPPEPEPVITPDMVDAERDRRIAAGFAFGGQTYQSRSEDRENIAGAALAAFAAIVNGAQADDLRWHGGGSDFTWIAADNSLTEMDALTMFAFGQAAMAHKQAHIFAGRALKDADPMPADYADDDWWP